MTDDPIEVGVLRAYGLIQLLAAARVAGEPIVYPATEADVLDTIQGQLDVIREFRRLSVVEEEED